MLIGQEEKKYSNHPDNTSKKKTLQVTIIENEKKSPRKNIISFS